MSSLQSSKSSNSKTSPPSFTIYEDNGSSETDGEKGTDKVNEKERERGNTGSTGSECHDFAMFSPKVGRDKPRTSSVDSEDSLPRSRMGYVD